MKKSTEDRFEPKDTPLPAGFQLYEESLIMFIIGLLAAPGAMLASPQHELTLQQVLKANTAAIQAIRSLHVTIEVSNNLPVPGDEKPPLEAQPTYSTDWYKDGSRRRVRQMWLRGRGPHSLDMYNGPKGFKALHNYDPNFNPPLSESIAAPAFGELDKQRIMEIYSPRAICGMVFSHKDKGDITLEEYVTAYPSSKLAATPATSKLGCYEIMTLEERITDSKLRDVKDLRIFVDPKVGFWVRRIEGGPWQKSTDPGDKGTGMMEVQEFRDCGNGLFWPMRFSTTVRLPGASIGLDILVRHTLHSINQPLPEEDFDIHFPDWLRVYDRPSGKIIIWGPDDEPRMTFASLGEYKEWYGPREKDPYQEATRLPERTRWVWLVGTSIFVGLLLGIILWWRNKKSRRLETEPISPEITSSPASGEVAP